MYNLLFVFSSLGYIPRNGIARLDGNSVINLLKNCQRIFQWLYNFTFPPAMVWSGILLWLWFAFPYYCHWASFHVPFGHLHVFFGEMSIKVFAYFLIGLLVFLLFSCKSSLHIPDTRTLSEKWFPNIFSCSVVCLFMFLIVFSHGKSFSFWWYSVYLLFLLLLILLVSYLRNHHLTQSHDPYVFF